MAANSIIIQTDYVLKYLARRGPDMGGFSPVFDPTISELNFVPTDIFWRDIDHNKFSSSAISFWNMGDRRIQNSLTRQPIHYDVRTLCQFDNLKSPNLDFQNLQ